MKGKKKYIVPLLLAGMTATTGIVTNVQQAVSVKAEDSELTNMNGSELQVTGGFDDRYNIGDTVYLPTVTKDYGEVKYTVTKGGKTVEVLTEDGTNKLYFIAKYEGYYNVSIEAYEKGRVVSTVDNLSVWVEKDDAVINLPINSEYVIPAKMPKNQEGFKIPAPTVTITDEDDEEVEKTAREIGANFRVKLITPSNSTGIILTLDSEKDYYAVDKTILSDAGTYQIVYEYLNGTSVISRLESNFQVVNEYDLSKVKLTMSFLDDVPSTGNVCTDISIPKIKVTESASSLDSINAKITVVVTNLTTKKTVEVDYENYTFHPTEEGYYTVTYKAEIPLFGLATAEVTPDQTIEVKDNQAPELRPTYSYTVVDGEITRVGDVAVTEDTDLDELLPNRKADIPSVAKLTNVDGKKSVKVTIPAIYAVDNFDSYADITLTRTYKTSGGALSTVTTPANEEAEIEFTTKGNHEIRYKATDKAGNTLGEVVYDIVVYDEDEDLTDGKTKIDLNVGTESVSDKEKTLEFSKPTATDTYDSEVDVRTFYTLMKGETEGDTIELVETNGNGKYEIDVTELADDVTSIKIYSVAYVDETLLGTRTAFETSTEVTSEVYTVNIIKSSLDELAPDFDMASSDSWNVALFQINEGKIIESLNGQRITSINDAGYAVYEDSSIVTNSQGTQLAAFEQGSNIIELPAIKFTEKYDNNLKITLTIKDKFGNDISKTQQETIDLTNDGSDYVYTVSGAQFKLSSYGVYTITYRAEDIGGNVTVKTFGIRVNDTTAPTITVDDEDKFGKQIEVGEYFKVPTARLVKNGEKVEGTISWEIYKTSDGAKYTKQTNGFTPLSEGSFFIRYTAIDEYGNTAILEDSQFYVSAKDTVAPEISLDLTNHLPSSMEWAPEDGDDFMKINIPVAFATDKLTKQDIVVEYTVSGPNGVKPTLYDYDDDDSVKYFKATSEGTYTIKYYAVDEAGNETTITKTLALGDCEKPTLTWNNQDEDLPTEVKLNEEFVLDLSKITLSDNKTSAEDLADNLTITLTSPDGSTVTNKGTEGVNYKWELTSTGSYTLKFVLKDDVGNSNTYTYSITVPSEDADEETISPVVGTVLVVLSVVVLAGVVIYFVASSKKKSSKSSSKSTKKSN